MRRDVMSGVAGLLLGSMLVGCGGGTAGDEEHEGEGRAVMKSPAHTEAGLEAHDVAYVPAALARVGPAVAYGDGKYFAVWTDVRTGGIYGTRVKQDGTVVDPEGIRINISDEPGSQPAIAFNGTHFFVVWQTDVGVDGVRVKPDGTVVGPVFRVIQTDESFGPVRVSCSPKVCLVTFTISGDAETVIFFTRVTKNGVVLREADRSLSAGFNFARDASSAWNNSKKEFLVVWSDEQGMGPENADIFGNRVTEDGVVLDGVGFPISTAEGMQAMPDVEWSGKRYQVVWSDDRDGAADIYGARVRSNGTVDDPDGIPISTAVGVQSEPRLAHHNSKSLVVWDDTRTGAHRIWGARWGENGEVWDPAGVPISGGDQAEEYLPDVAYGGNKFFTAYAGWSSVALFEPPHFILGTRVTHQLEVKDDPALVLTLEPALEP
ncbi:hypothetical protein [Myxococcus sp. Y35]|uniref:hypothetical protein n=1 Tax=Pseudomyxococcus flavus TaxID=3115648 RepID=UPI003CF8D1D2